MVGRHQLEVAGDLIEGDEFGVLAAGGDHHAVLLLADSVGGRRPEPGGEQPVGGARRPAALHVAEDRHPRLQAGGSLQFAGELEGVFALRVLDVREVRLGRTDGLRSPGRLHQQLGGLVVGSVVDVPGALGDGDHREGRALAQPGLDGLGDALDRVGDLRQQDDVGAPGDAGAQRQPAGAVAHDLGEDDPVVAVRGGVQPVDGLGGDLHRGREAEGRVGAGDVVVDGLGQRHHVQPGLGQAQRVLRRPPAAEQDEGVQAVLLVVLDHLRTHVAGLAVDDHAVHLVAAGAQDRAADGEDARQRLAVHRHEAVLDQPADAVPEADQFHAVVADCRLAEAADRGVQAGAVTAGGEDADPPLAGLRGHGRPFRLLVRVAAGRGRPGGPP